MSAPRAAPGEGEAHQKARERPARPTRPRRAGTRTHARDQRVAFSQPKGAVSASTRNSPGAPAESPVERQTVHTYDFSSCFFPKFKVMHFQNGDIKLYTVVLLFLCFLKILTKLCCRWSWSCRSTVNNCRVRELQIVDRRAQKKIARKSTFFRSWKQSKGMSVSPRSIPCC